MSRKQPKRRAGNMVSKAMAGIFIVAIICGVGFGVASADSSDDVARSDALGFDKTTQLATASAHLQQADDSSVGGGSYYEPSALASISLRTIDSGMKMLDERDRAYRRHIAHENAVIGDRVQAQKAKQGFVDYGLPEVDWSVGQEAFLSEWTARIDAYLAGSPLEGCGYYFASAAWDNGVDPRWSPAISCTESSRGSFCFLPNNAWGWGQSAWDDWESAIRAHVRGLAEVYGYSVTREAAAIYCPPNTAFWYANTFEQMGRI